MSSGHLVRGMVVPTPCRRCGYAEKFWIHRELELGGDRHEFDAYSEEDYTSVPPFLTAALPALFGQSIRRCAL